MTSSVISLPSRIFSFADWSRSRPKEPPPGDRIDAQIANLIDAIHTTQQALADIRRADGKLKNQSVGHEQLAVALRHTPGVMDEVEARIRQNASTALQAAAEVVDAERSISLRATDAERAAVASAQFLSAVEHAKRIVDQALHRVVNLTQTSEADAAETENWATYSKAQADNAIKAKDEALQWAEYLAGPVVDAVSAPAYIASSNFPHGLFYQPVEGYGGAGGLWSAKWWAVYAAQLVGAWNFYYLGAWPAPPMPGASNPATGVKVPNPLAKGSFYYDTTTGQLYIWDGGQWVAPYSLAPAYQNQFVYLATAGQTVFSGPDHGGKTPVVGMSPSDAHLNGVRLVEGTDYTINASTSALTLLNIVPTVNSVLQWDLLVPTSNLAPGAVNAFKVAMTPAAPDGVATVFTMTYSNPSTGTKPVAATNNAQLLVVLDGIVQEPGVDFTAAGNTLTMAAPPLNGAHFWAVWLANAVLAP